MQPPPAAEPRWPTGILAFVVVAAPLALGAVHLPSRMVVGWLGLVAMAWAMVYGAHRRHRGAWGLLGAGLVVATAAGLAQWIPLPAGLVEALSVGSHEARTATAAALGTSAPAWHPLSLDGPRTAAMWVQLVGMLALFLAAFHVSHGRTGRRALPLAVEVAGLAVFAVGAVQTVLGADRIYGVYMPSTGVIRDFFPTSFVNSNHAAALMLLSGTLAAGQWLSSQVTGRERRFHQVVWLATLTGVILSASRANIALAVPAMGLLALLARRERPTAPTQAEPDPPRHPILRPALATLAIAVVLLVAAGPDRWLEQVALGTHSLQVALDEVVWARWEIGAAVAGEAPWSGVGLGAFATASPAATSDWARGYVDHAHNAALQTVSAFGLPLGVLILTLVVVGFLVAAWRARRRLDAAAVAIGLGALGIQNLVDFSLMVPGVGCAAAVSAGWLVAVTRKRGRRGEAPVPGRRFHLALGAAIVTGLTVLVALATTRAVEDGHRSWEERVRAAIADDAPQQVDLADMLHAHPADYRLVLLSSIVAAAGGEPERSLALAGRARDLAPREPTVILQHARAALAAGRQEAALGHLERLAGARPSGLRLATREVLRHGTEEGLAEGYFRRDPEFVLEATRELRRRGHAAAAARLAEWGLEHHPDSLALREVLAELWMRDPDRADDIDDLSVDALVMGAQGDGSRARALKRLGYLLQGYTLQREGRPEEAWHMFEEAARLEPARSARPLEEAARILIARGDRPERLERTLEALDAVTEHDDTHRAVYHHLRAMVAERRGDEREAVRQLQRASLHDEHNPVYRGELIRLYEALGDDAAADRVRAQLAGTDAR